MKVGLTDQPRLRDAFREAGIGPWHEDLQLTAGDILFLGTDIAPRILGHIRGLLLVPDVDIILVTDAARRPAEAAGLPYPLLRLPTDRAELTRLRTVLHATTLTPTTDQLTLITARLEVRHGDPALITPGREWARRDLVRAGILNAGLPWPDAAMTLTWQPLRTTGHRSPLPVTPGAEADLALAAVLLAAADGVSQAALQRVVFVGRVAPDGQVHPVPTLPPFLPTVREAGFRHLATPAGTSLVPVPAGLTVYPVTRLQDLTSLDP
ncbi:hypothetical protein [Frankia sp. ACN1ag]|uniref:hypothetical protein n=1 Tax=Frankia sp. ACN1ag TaxID=102891 RepID=UPI0006DD3631|nr:hypothetical protein [Frankia sp. ACN1ag]KQC37904.1 hypothetical protein UK82_12975 [Frankia sp. ACN1ag]